MSSLPAIFNLKDCEKLEIKNLTIQDSVMPKYGIVLITGGDSLLKIDGI
jgi:hypothetical protein